MSIVLLPPMAFFRCLWSRAIAHEIEGERKKEEGRREKREEKEGREKRETVQLYTVHRYSPWSTTVIRINWHRSALTILYWLAFAASTAASWYFLISCKLCIADPWGVLLSSAPHRTKQRGWLASSTWPHACSCNNKDMDATPCTRTESLKATP